MDPTQIYRLPPYCQYKYCFARDREVGTVPSDRENAVSAKPREDNRKWSPKRYDQREEDGRICGLAKNDVEGERGEMEDLGNSRGKQG